MCSHSISRQADGIRQELHERSGGAESLKHQIQEIIAGDFLICQRSAEGEVLALDVVDERVSRVVTGWRPLQRFACHAACRAKGTTRDRAAPPFGISGDLVSNFFERLWLRLPDSAADHGIAWFEMQVIYRSCPGLALSVPEVRSSVCFVGTLVLWEANVPIDAHHQMRIIEPPLGLGSAVKLPPISLSVGARSAISRRKGSRTSAS